MAKQTTTTEKLERRAYNVNDACHALGISRASLYKSAKAGKIRLVRIAGRTLVAVTEVNRLLGETGEARS